MEITGEDSDLTQKILSSFICKQDEDIENFLHNRALEFEKLSKKGFSSYIRSEKRSSGKTYYAVLVDDTDGSMEKKLKSAGFDCYPVK